MKFNTKCVHGSGKPDSTGAISPAIYMSSTFSHPVGGYNRLPIFARV